MAIWGKKISMTVPSVSTPNGAGARHSTAMEQGEWRASTWQNQFGTAGTLPPPPAEDDLVLTPEMIESETPPQEPMATAAEPVIVALEPVADEPAAPEPEAASPIAAPPAEEAVERTDDGGRSQFFAGQGVKMKAEVSGCDVFRIEGDFDGTVVARRMFIAPTGIFKGTGTVEEAVVEGRIEGTLVVTGVLALRATGRVSGSVSYGLIEIERGGHLHGEIMPKSMEPGATRPAPIAAAPPAPMSAPRPAAAELPPARRPVLAAFGAKRSPG